MKIFNTRIKDFNTYENKTLLDVLSTFFIASLVDFSKFNNLVT